jgi:hypothetical protein
MCDSHRKDALLERATDCIEAFEAGEPESSLRDPRVEALDRIVRHARAVQSGEFGEHTGWSVAEYCIEVVEGIVAKAEPKGAEDA